jgi:hypothetical protein
MRDLLREVGAPPLMRARSALSDTLKPAGPWSTPEQLAALDGNGGAPSIGRMAAMIVTS